MARSDKQIGRFWYAKPYTKDLCDSVAVAREVMLKVKPIVKAQPHLVIPVGTKVLARSQAAATGRVGVVSHTPATPEHAYRVRFAEGDERPFHRTELTIFKHTDTEVPGGPEPKSLFGFVQYRCIVGSRAYGLDHAGSDLDRRGFFLLPAHLHWGLASVPDQIESEQEECYWEVEKFIRLGLKANPNVLECMYSPLVETCTPLAQELIDMRDIFLSRHIHRTYNSYVLSQFKKMEQDLRNARSLRWKHVMHLIRLLLSGVVVLKKGFVPLRVKEHRDRLLAIRRGEIAWDEIEAWRLQLHRELDEALQTTSLPEHPDFARANDFLLRMRRHAASEAYASEVTLD